MESVEIESSPFSPDCAEDFSSAVLSQFSNSNNEHHLHVCDIIGAMSQELREQGLPLTPITYFGATCSSLQRLSSCIDSAGPLLDALLTILSLVVARLPPDLLKTNYSYLSELIHKTLRVKSIGVNGVVPGLKCISRLIIVREKAVWEDVAELYGVLIGYMTDDRYKVRKRSHICLRNVLRCFQLVPTLSLLLASASEAITNVFVRFLLLAGGSNENISVVSETAQDVLRILDALKICLPYMSSKSTTNILEHFKSLLTLRRRIVTRPITDGLNALCLHSGAEISAEILLDLLCSLASSGSMNDSSADSMTFTARLLDIGMKRVYTLNRQICVVKLPLVFNALKDILASGHEEALVAASATLKSLIHSCIDENLIKQGVDRITGSANSGTMKSVPTVIEKLCATIDSLLGYHYVAVLDMSFQIVSTMFEKLGKYSFFFVEGTLESLVEMHTLPDGDFGLRKECSFQNISQNSFQDKLQTDTNASNTPQGWSEQEDIALMSAWCFVSTNAIISTNQTSVKLWKNVLNLYEQRRVDTPGMGKQRTSESLRNRYKRINANVTKWIGVYKKVHDQATSSQSKEDIEKTTQKLYGKNKFTHHAVFERVMCHNPKWELKLNSTGSTHFQRDEDSLEESRGSSKRSRTSEDGEPQIDSTPGSDSSRLQRPIGRNKTKANAKRKGKEVASQLYPIPDDFSATLREMRLTREKECEIQERKIKASTLNTLIGRRDLSPEEEALKRHLMADLYGM